MDFLPKKCVIPVYFLATVLARIDECTEQQNHSRRGACRSGDSPSHAPVGAGSLLQAKVYDGSNATDPVYTSDCHVQWYSGRNPTQSYLRSYRTLGCPLPHQTQVYEIRIRQGVEFSIQIPNMRGLDMMVYTRENLPNTEQLQCEDLRVINGSDWRLTGGVEAKLGHARFFENRGETLGYTRPANSTDLPEAEHRRRRSGSSSILNKILFGKDTTLVVAIHRSGNSACAFPVRYFKMEFAQARNTNCLMEFNDATCRICPISGCDLLASSQSSSAGSAGSSSSSIETAGASIVYPFQIAGAAVGDSSAVGGNSVGGLAPPTE